MISLPIKKESLNMTSVIYSCCEELSISINQLKCSIERYEERKKNKIKNKEASIDNLEILDDRRD